MALVAEPVIQAMSVAEDAARRRTKFEEAAAAYTNYTNLLPNKDHSEKADWSRADGVVGHPIDPFALDETVVGLLRPA